MKQHVIVFCLIAWCWAGAEAQTEFNAKIGISAWSLRDEKELVDVSRHPGQFVGFDVLIEKNRKVFSPGFHYHRISVMNEDHTFSLDLSPSHHMHFFTIPLTGGYKVLDAAAMNISLLAGGEINFFYSLDDNDAGLDDDMFYGISTGLTGIVHAEFLTFVTLELRYHYALQPIIKIRDKSKLRGLTVGLGAKF